MNEALFDALLNNLHLQTLARILIDLEETQEEWRHNAAAPPDSFQQDIKNILKAITEVGTARAEAERLEFQQFLEDVREERRQADWLAERNRRDRENWFKDYE